MQCFSEESCSVAASEKRLFVFNSDDLSLSLGSGDVGRELSWPTIALSDEVIVTLGERVELRLKLVFSEARELEVVAAHDALDVGL